MSPRREEMRDMSELFREEEDAAMERTRREMAAEQKAWDALPQEERDRITAERNERWAAMWDADTDADDDAADDEDEEEGDDEEAQA